MIHTEIDVSYIWDCLADFWKLFQNKETVEQVWRGYTQALTNLYYQLYQTNLSKSIETIPHRWLTDWELIIFDDSTKVDDSIEGFPYCFKLPNGLKDITYLVESPRNGIRVPLNSTFTYEKRVDEHGIPVLDEDGKPIIDTYVKFPGSKARPYRVVLLEDPKSDSRPLIACHVLKSGSDFVIKEISKRERRIYLSRNISSYMWAHRGIRDSYSIYDTFGYLLKFYKEDSLQYLREVQGLWLSYLSSPTPASLVRGLVILRSLPFALDSGVVQSLSIEPSTLLMHHKPGIYLLKPHEDTTLLDQRNTQVNNTSNAVLTSIPIYEASGQLRSYAEDPTLPAESFVKAGLRVADYVYSLDETNCIAAFSLTRTEQSFTAPAEFLTKHNLSDHQIDHVYQPDSDHISFTWGSRTFVLPNSFPLPSNGSSFTAITPDGIATDEFTILSDMRSAPGFLRVQVGDIVKTIGENYITFESGTTLALPHLNHVRLDILKPGDKVAMIGEDCISFDNPITIPLDESYLGPLQPGWMLTDSKSLDDSISYIEFNNILRFPTNREWSEEFQPYVNSTLLYVSNPDITLGSVVNVKLPEDIFRQLFVGDTIDKVDPPTLSISINNRSYSYTTDCDPIVTVGQYVNKYDPLVDAIHIVDWVKNPKWMFTAYGIDEDEATMTHIFKGSLFDVANPTHDSGLYFDQGFNQEVLNILVQKYHTFMVEFDESAIPTDYETLNLITSFLKTAKPTYTDTSIIMHLTMSDDFVMGDEFLPIQAEYEWEENYPWADKHYATFDNEACCDTDICFDTSSSADELDLIAVLDQDINEEYWGNSNVCFDNGHTFDSNKMFDGDEVDTLTLSSDGPDNILMTHVVKAGKPISLFISTDVMPDNVDLIADTRSDHFYVPVELVIRPNMIIVTSNIDTDILRDVIKLELHIDEDVFKINIAD